MSLTDWNTPPTMIGRVDAILRAFKPDDRELRIADLAARTGLAKSTVSRIVQELVEYRYLDRTDQALRLGLRVFELGERAAQPRGLRKLAITSMANLRQAVQHTVHFAVLEGTEVVYLEILPTRNGPPLPSRVGGRLPAHATGLGKAMLSVASPGVVAGVMETGLPKVGPRTITDPTALTKELARIRSTGLSYEREESGPKISCVASAITLPSGAPLAAISVSGWSGTLDLRRIGPAVKTMAVSLTREVANRPELHPTEMLGRPQVP